ncbi:sensor histidine kinase [Halobacillus aidingensis]|uniref:Two-component system, NarL family, sensor histidine kinase ComP n=3 Tax=Halobacillus TaxID=45667 RepID=A0A1H0PAJ8_HALAD|nr:ATP-binding protein [Halobacillus aidingensis]SDP01760.1 two-component system, NarL family, sensor histidine kinase ComP [Halobacillus aidingensis]
MFNFKWSQWLVLSFFILSACYMIVLSVTQPYLGIGVNERQGEWVVTSVHSGSWGDRHGFPLGGEIHSINDEPPEEHRSVSMFNELEGANSFSIQHNGQETFYNDIENSSPIHWLLYIVIPALFFLVILGISYLVHKRVPKRYSAEQLILFFLAIATGYLSNSGAVRDDLYGLFLNTGLFLFSPVILIHFLYNYFQELNIYWFSKKIVYSLYLTVGFVSLLEGYFLTIESYPAFFDPIPGGLLLVLYIISFFIIYRGLYIHKSAAVGPIFKYMAIGMTIAFFPYIFLYLIPALAFGVKVISLEVGAMFLIALPITFMYLVTRERLIDIDFVMTRVRYYMILSVLPSLALMFTIGWLVEEDLYVISYIQMFLLFQSAFVLFLSVKEVLDFKLQRYLFSARYGYQESMHRMAQDMKDQSNAVDLMKVMRDEVKNVLNVRDIYIYSKHNKRNMYCVYDQIPRDIIDHFDEHLNNHHYDIGSVIETEKGFGVIVGYSLEKLTMMWCKGKKDYTTLNRDEKTYLQTISHNANIAIQNMNTIEDLLKELRKLRSGQTQKYPTWLSRLLFTIAENQRKQLSIDLHDTVLQEQLYLYRKMDDLIRHRNDLTSSLHAELMVYKESLLDSIHLIRETCNELRPAFIEEMGLVQSLKNLIHQYQLRSNFTVYFSDERFDAELDQERILAIFRVVQELLTNAMKHSDAKIVKLSLSSQENQVMLLYSDNGKGMDYSVQRDLFSHIGLSGIEQRVNGLNGHLEIETALGEGFKTMITFPIEIKREVQV